MTVLTQSRPHTGRGEAEESTYVRGGGGGGSTRLLTNVVIYHLRYTLERVLRRGRGKSPKTESPNMEEVCTLRAIA